MTANITPILNQLDNVASDDLINAIKNKGLMHQIITAHNHHLRLVEYVIGTFKNHLILVSMDLTNIFQYIYGAVSSTRSMSMSISSVKSRINPHCSTYEELFGTFDFNATPLALIGAQPIIYQTSGNYTIAYINHGKKGWYIGPYMDKYRNYCVYITQSKGI